MSDGFKGVAKHAMAACAGLAAVLALSIGATAASPTPATYCARQNAIFKDRRAFVGMADPYVEEGSQEFRNCSFGLMAAAHVGVFRGGLSWAQTEYPAGHYVFVAFDELVAELAR